MRPWGPSPEETKISQGKRACLFISRADPARMKGTDAGEGRASRAVLEWPRPTAWGKTSGSEAGEHFSILTKPRRGR